MHHDVGKLRGEVQLGHILVETENRREDQPPSVGQQKLVRVLEVFGFALLFRDEHSIQIGDFHLHIGDARAGRRAGGILYRKFRQADQLPQALLLAVIGDEGIVHIHMQSAVERRSAVLEENAPITHEAA